jgi:AraC family transcriptional regulator
MNKSSELFLGDTFISRNVNGCTIALTHYSNKQVFEEWHSHEHSSISLLLNGTHEEDLTGEKLKRLPGDIKFIPAGKVHRCHHYANDTRKINIDLGDAFIRQIAVAEDRLVRSIPNALNTKFTLIKLYRELNDTGSHAHASAGLLLYDLFNPATRANTQSGTIPVWAERLRELLNDEWDRPFHLEDLSTRLGIHPVTISRYFPVYFSATLGIYINQIKINKALALIKNTHLPLTEIAYTCGFADQAHFTRTFKTFTGCLPKEFRKL